MQDPISHYPKQQEQSLSWTKDLVACTTVPLLPTLLFSVIGVLCVLCVVCVVCVFCLSLFLLCFVAFSLSTPTNQQPQQQSKPPLPHTNTHKQPPTHTHTHTHWFWLGHPHSAWSKREGQVGVLVVSVDQNFHFARQTYRKCTNGSRGDCFSLSSCRVCGFPRVAAAGGLTAAVLFLCLFLPLACLTIYQRPHIPPNTLVCLHFSSCLFFSKQLFWCWFFFFFVCFSFRVWQTDRQDCCCHCLFFLVSFLFVQRGRAEKEKSQRTFKPNQNKVKEPHSPLVPVVCSFINQPTTQHSTAT